MNLSTLEIGPIFRALMRNKVGAILIAIQIAITMTIIVNSVFIIYERSQLMKRESGIDEANSFHLSSSGFANDFNPKETIQKDLEAIRALPGVVNAIQMVNGFANQTGSGTRWTGNSSLHGR
jgi:putative ABC transport system permease protein